MTDKPNSTLLSLNTATVKKQWNLEQIITGCVKHNIQGISPWRDQTQALGLKKTATLIKQHNMTVTGYCRGGMFTTANAEDHKKILEDNYRAVDEALSLNSQCLVLVVGGLPKGSKDIVDARKQVIESIATLLEYSRSVSMPLAIEPLHPMQAADRACINTVGQANDICDLLGDDGLGIAIDLYHTWWDPRLYEELKRAGKKRILAFHICDWLVPTIDLLNDRGMMGDGVIDIRRIRKFVENLGYQGFHEVEIFSEHWWKQDPDLVLETCKKRHLDCC